MTMTHVQIHEQGMAHYQSIKNGEPVIPPSYFYPNMDYDDAYAIAGEIIKRYLADGYEPSGKKCGLTSNAMRSLANIHEPDYGIIFHQLCYTNESCIPIDRFVQPGIEAEVAFKLKDDLIGPNVTMERVLSATEYVVPCLEVVDVRQKMDKQRKVLDSIADNASHGAYVIGDTPIMPYEIDFGLIGFIYERNGQQQEAACGAAVLDHPAKAIAWLANRFTELGNPLQKGELILSGSAITLQMAKKGDNFRCRYGKFGEVSVTFV